MLDELTARDLAEWRAYLELEPFDADRIVSAVAILSSLTANIHRDKHGRRFGPGDFMPKWEEGRAQSPAELLAKVKSLNALFGGNVVG